MASLEYALPVELWRRILMKIPPADLCSVVLTSRHMNTMASLPELWTGMKVNVRKVREIGLKELYSVNRFKKIKQIKLSGVGLTSEKLEWLFNDILRSPLENIDLEFVNLSGIHADLLARTVYRLRTVHLFNNKLTTEQCVKFLEASLYSNTLVNVNLSCVDLSGVPADLLSRVVCRLGTVKLEYTDLTNGQCVGVLEASLSSSTLVSVDLTYVNLSQVPPDLLARAISRLRSVNLKSIPKKTETGLTSEQCVRVFKSILSSNTLTSVNLSHINLSEVPSDLLSKAVCRLESIILEDTRLTTEQSVVLLNAIPSSTTLRLVDLRENQIHLKVPENIRVSVPDHVKI